MASVFRSRRSAQRFARVVRRLRVAVRGLEGCLARSVHEVTLLRGALDDAQANQKGDRS